METPESIRQEVVELLIERFGLARAARGMRRIKWIIRRRAELAV